MEIVNEKTLFEMFPGINVEKLKKLFDEADYKAYSNLIKVSRQLRERKDLGDTAAAFSSAYPQLIGLLEKKLESLGYTRTYISAAAMIEDGSIK